MMRWWDARQMRCCENVRQRLYVFVPTLHLTPTFWHNSLKCATKITVIHFMSKYHFAWERARSNDTILARTHHAKLSQIQSCWKCFSPFRLSCLRVGENEIVLMLLLIVRCVAMSFAIGENLGTKSIWEKNTQPPKLSKCCLILDYGLWDLKYFYINAH